MFLDHRAAAIRAGIGQDGLMNFIDLLRRRPMRMFACVLFA
jgi:hypothetical protein